MNSGEKIQSTKRIEPVGTGHVTCISIIGFSIWIVGLGVVWEIFSVYSMDNQLMGSQITDGGSIQKFLKFLLMSLLIVGAFYLLVNCFIRRSKMRSSILQTYLEGNTSTRGTVVNKRVSPGDMDSPDRYFISVQFNTESGSYTLSSEVNRRVYKNATKGGSIGIRYADTDPRIVLFEGEY